MASVWSKCSRQHLHLRKLCSVEDFNFVKPCSQVFLSICRKLNYALQQESAHLRRMNINSLPNNRILDYPRLKAVAEDRINISLCYNKVHKLARSHSSSTDEASDSKNKVLNPFSLVDREVAFIQHQVKFELKSANKHLRPISEYYFDGKGKAFRPMLILLMARALNHHLGKPESVLPSQLQIAMIAEMIHTASLMHDDVIDHADTRRGKSSINSVWGQRKSILAGDYVMAMASIVLAKIRNEEVVSVVSQITEDLVKGEFMQLGSKENEHERFSHYLKKTFKKTASLLANSCKAVAVLTNGSDEMTDIAYEYGKNIGICFQLIDDLLDFTSCDNVMGKPTAADLGLGLATAPVLFAAKKYPELNSMIMRRFSEEGDVEKARDLVAKSNGVKQTRELAEQHSTEALDSLKTLIPSDSLKGLESISELVLNRNK